MDIISYLLELLQQRKEVGITGLGTFFKKKSPGRYDKEQQSFLPPTYSLQFTSDVKEDEALVNFISAKRNISAESAAYYVSQFVDETKQKLEVEHEAELADLGRLFFTEHEGLSFEPVENINYGSEFYGLPSLPETVNENDKNTSAEHEEEVYEEIAEAPAAPSATEEAEGKNAEQPIIENIELDEVKDDLKNTMGQAAPVEAEITDAPEFIKEQHEEHPNRFGHAPESETQSGQETEQPEEEVIPAPEFIKEQHEEHPNRFGHAPESETQNEEEITATANTGQSEKDTDLHPNNITDEPVIEAPEFIKEQHAEHPNRFGHDPMQDEPAEEGKKSVWPTVIIVIVVLAIIGAAIYFLKPDLFNQKANIKTQPVTVADTQKVAIDTAKAKQDSIAKTDSILRANQVGAMKADAVEKKTDAPKTVAATPKNITFEIIAASYETVKGAERYINGVKKVGINARVVDMPGKRQNISIGSFKTEKEAKAQRDILQKKLKGKGFYVQQIVNNTQP